ncbi:MAG TPA: site-specific DNA-methyltransferase [Deltaproteobacteria bacterium]|nr:MAG: DNA methylase [Deltaproteobacteria bacterium GWA2_55_82]OGQ64140.1 MAG: DNA methylase [Deltaproteobacteria bacterium RIFCSPLOWO2_02_FULL_55_12]OIJ74592.1 MAG: DNA methylase [Deltaproteobacteria bacterium GWC2_55_46]HBG46465.1 site-specific DNA-methyltransferase [Deltaproteobacteria bacterium]HCY10677.1 site-specific DNA-methyltransferase [Deltaproteobacteria bacterium]
MPTLNWLTKGEDIRAAGKAPYRLLEAVPEHSAGSASENMLIHGDNLEALKALLPYYAGKIKCIYIDPPYNTRSAFTHYDDSLEHSIWLAMIYPRLELLRELLSEEGSIWVSIDDNEGHYLKVIMDEIFGRKNFVANVIWQKKYAKQNDAKWLSISHDHILLFAKDKESWRPNELQRTESQLKGYSNPDNDPRGPWQSVVYTCAKTRAERPNLYYPIIHPKTGKEIFPSETRVWGYEPKKHEEHIKEERIWWGKNFEKDKPRLKSYLKEVGEGIVPDTLWLRADAGDNQDAKREVRAFNEKASFDTPKPEKLIQRILQLASNSGDLLLDSFLGSGTAAAVAHKMGRRYIGIEMGDHAITHCAPRLKKVIEGEQGGISQAVNWQGGGGFRFYKLGEPVFDENGQINPKVRFKALAAHVWFSETGIPYVGKANKPFLGIHNGIAYSLLYNGILGDKRVNGGNVLTRPVLKQLDKESGGFEGPWVIYGEMSRISVDSLRAEKITFKQTPYDVRAR